MVYVLNGRSILASFDNFFVYISNRVIIICSVYSKYVNNVCIRCHVCAS